MVDGYGPPRVAAATKTADADGRMRGRRRPSRWRRAIAWRLCADACLRHRGACPESPGVSGRAQGISRKVSTTTEVLRRVWLPTNSEFADDTAQHRLSKLRRVYEAGAQQRNAH